MKPIAMRCSQEQFDKIKGKLDTVNITVFTKRSYLINNYCGEIGKVTNLSYSNRLLFDRTVYETWDEDIFLEACDIIPEYKLPDNWAIRGCEELANYLKTVDNNKYKWCGDNKHFFYIIDKYDNQWYRSLSFGLTEITLEQYLKSLKTNSMQKLTISINELLEIHKIACIEWKSKISNYMSRLDKNQDITLTQEELDEMFRASNANQLPVLERIFEKKDDNVFLDNISNNDLRILNEKLFGKQDVLDLGREILKQEDNYLRNKCLYINSSYKVELLEDKLGDKSIIKITNKYEK